jgi:hypothetical protein
MYEDWHLCSGVRKVAFMAVKKSFVDQRLWALSSKFIARASTLQQQGTLFEMFPWFQVSFRMNAILQFILYHR